ncbi:uncharacterized protein LOC107046211 [Diachasma alloeum]|uniref:uncharacterized protein LOC107046211 n=1 Tax=Diachasma alloeum TaxID=454923 RepID=UPI00073836E5|nr:uncharacterized protein LOC107046211 [Diachasma alloeum]
MATDVKESDTEEHERPAPAKRQCMKIVNIHDEMTHQTAQDPAPEVETEFERTERLIREKLRRWQACQMAKGFVDNTINRVMENYILGPQVDASQFRLFRGTDMEDTAVMMAIRNHGLVHSGQFEDESDLYQSFSNSVERNEFPKSKNFDIPLGATSSKIISSSQIDNCQESMKEKNDEGGDEQDFLERAVAEAIKIKGLSALSVDYG